MDKLSFYEPADIEIYIKDRGIVLKEKSLIAIEMEEKLQKILAMEMKQKECLLIF